jgi:hypothetical protein
MSTILVVKLMRMLIQNHSGWSDIAPVRILLLHIHGIFLSSASFYSMGRNVSRAVVLCYKKQNVIK